MSLLEMSRKCKVKQNTPVIKALAFEHMPQKKKSFQNCHFVVFANFLSSRIGLRYILHITKHEGLYLFKMTM